MCTLIVRSKGVNKLIYILIRMLLNMYILITYFLYTLPINVRYKPYKCTHSTYSVIRLKGSIIEKETYTCNSEPTFVKEGKK